MGFCRQIWPKINSTHKKLKRNEIQSPFFEFNNLAKIHAA
jgi:hypothetical protein